MRSSSRPGFKGLVASALAAGFLAACGGDSGDAGGGGRGGTAAGGRGSGGSGVAGMHAGSAGSGPGGSGIGGFGGSHGGAAGGTVVGSGGAAGSIVVGSGGGGAAGGIGGAATGGVPASGGAPGTGGAVGGRSGVGGTASGGTGVGGGGARGGAAGSAAGGSGTGGLAGSGVAGSGVAGSGVAGTGVAGNGGGGAGGSTVVSCSGTSMVPGRPVLWAPIRGAYTGNATADAALMTLRPTFVWHAPAGCAADTYELQVDNSCAPGQIANCAFPSPEIATSVPSSTTRFTPSTALAVQTTAPVGAVYSWRVRACAGAGACGAWSEVGYLNVGRVLNDINGDGYADLVAQSIDRTTFAYGFEIYPGSAAPAAATSVHLAGPSLGRVAYYSGPIFVGDVNGDGFGDFLCLSYDPISTMTTPLVFFGGANLAALNSVFLLTSAVPNHLNFFADAGDINGDGFSDIIQDIANGVSSEPLTFNVYFGAAAFVAKGPDLHTMGPLTTGLIQVDFSAGIGDLNGDGFPDVAIFHTADHTGLIRIFLGGSAPDLTSDGDISLADFSAVPAGDLDGDGYDDVVVSQIGYGILHGGPTIPTGYSVIDPTNGVRVALAGFDINADGHPDLLLSGGRGLVLGGPTLTPASGLASLTADSSSRQVTWADYNGDGRPDFADGDATTHQLILLLNDGTLNPPATSPLSAPSAYALSGSFAYGH